jgi:hypothetical protein
LIERVEPALSAPARLLASVCVDWPNSGLVRLLVGAPKFGWLKRLKNSPRKTLNVKTEKFLVFGSLAGGDPEPRLDG